MDENDYEALQHIRNATSSIVRIMDGVSIEEFHQDEMRALAIVRLLEILGEAARRLSPGFTATYTEVEWSQIVSTRNRLIHGYFDVDLGIVWTIATRDVPILQQAVQQILDEGGWAN